MPYGVKKKYGGDSPANDASMEDKVNAIQKGGKSKVSAIKIAKSQGDPKPKRQQNFSKHFRNIQQGKYKDNIQ